LEKEFLVRRKVAGYVLTSEEEGAAMGEESRRRLEGRGSRKHTTRSSRFIEK
jgi:hypothetical protein